MIVNQYGSPVASNKFLEGGANRANRPRNQSPQPRDWDEIVTSWDHKTVVGRSRKLYSNNGTIRAVLQQISKFSIGNAWVPKPLAKDTEWASLASDYLNKVLRKIEVRGYDWWDSLYILSLAIDRDGDVGLCLTESKNGFPQIQIISSHKIGSRDDSPTVKTGSYKGFKIIKGCVINKFGRTIAYHILGDTEADDRYVSENDFIFLKDPDYLESVRGVSLIAHAINDMADVSEAHKREMTAMLINSTTAYQENADNSIDLDEAAYDPNDTVSTRPQFEQLDEGRIQIIRPGNGGKIEAVPNANRPGAEWESFNNRLIKSCVIGCGWSMAMLDHEGFSSVDNHISVSQCQNTVKDRQHLIEPAAQRICSWIIAKAIKAGNLPPNDEWYKFKFSKPAFISVNPSRFDASTRANLEAEIVTMTQICESMGTDYEQHRRELEEERAIAIRIRKETEAKYGVELEPITDKA